MPLTAADPVHGQRRAGRDRACHALAYAYPGFMAVPASSLEHGGELAIDLFADNREYYWNWSRSAR